MLLLRHIIKLRTEKRNIIRNDIFHKLQQQKCQYSCSNITPGRWRFHSDESVSPPGSIRLQNLYAVNDTVLKS